MHDCVHETILLARKSVRASIKFVKPWSPSNFFFLDLKITISGIQNSKFHLTVVSPWIQYSTKQLHSRKNKPEKEQVYSCISHWQCCVYTGCIFQFYNELPTPCTKEIEKWVNNTAIWYIKNKKVWAMRKATADMDWFWLKWRKHQYKWSSVFPTYH